MKYIIDIPEPCSEDWESMTTTQKGAYCSRCKKEVVDFTEMSDYEIGRLLATDFDLCGSFKPDQLNRSYKVYKERKHNGYGVLLTISALLGLSAPVFSQSNTPNAEISCVKDENIPIDSKNDQNSVEPQYLIGNVTDKSGKPLLGVEITIVGLDYSEYTNSNGDFSIDLNKLPSNFKKNTKVFIFFKGYKPKIKRMNRLNHVILVKDKWAKRTTGTALRTPVKEGFTF